MPLKECLERVTHREFQTWQHWLDEQWNKPDRTDHYLMRIALEVATVLSTKRQDIPLDKFKIPFEIKGSKPKIDVATVTARSKSRWQSFLKRSK